MRSYARWMRRASYHEAGHVVAHLALGHGFEFARVYEQPTISHAGVLCLAEVKAGAADLERNYLAIELAVAALAGPIAEARIMHQSLSSIALGGGGTDFDNAEDYLAVSRFTMLDAQQWAARLVSRNWSAVESVAAVLIHQGRVDHLTATACVGITTPAMP